MSVRSSLAAKPVASCAPLLTILCFWFFPVQAGAADLTGFLPPAGEGAVAFGYTDESYDEFWVGKARVSEPALGEISTRSATLWLSWGFSDRLALIADVAYVESSAAGPAGLEDSGPQDASLLFARRLWRRGQGRIEHSLVAAAGLRTAVEAYEENAPVARGDQTTDGLARLVYLLRAGRFYWSQQVGFDLRGGEAPDAFPLYTEIGWSAGRFTWIAGFSFLFADGGTNIGEPGFTFPSNREEFARLSAKVVGDVTARWSLFAGAFNTLDGRNSGDSSGLSLGAIHRF